MADRNDQFNIIMAGLDNILMQQDAIKVELQKIRLAILELAQQKPQDPPKR